jgi:hypothetical protein
LLREADKEAAYWTIIKGVFFATIGVLKDTVFLGFGSKT